MLNNWILLVFWIFIFLLSVCGFISSIGLIMDATNKITKKQEISGWTKHTGEIWKKTNGGVK